VVSLRGTVVGLGRPDFAIEDAEIYRLDVNANFRLPALTVASPGNSLVFRAEGFVLSFRLISGVLGGCRRAKVCLAIVQLVVIDVVYK
jgi:hypothetical protein